MSKVLTYNIFAYGTLRRGGAYHRHYLRYCTCQQAFYRLPGYALYDFDGQYPFMVPEADSVVVGDVFRINEATKVALDEFEGVEEGLYRFVYLPEHQFHIYVKSDQKTIGMPRVPYGDWLTYCSNE